LFFGILRRNKGLNVLLRAAEQLPDFAITIAGEPQEPEFFRDNIEPTVRRLQAAGAKVELIPRYLADADVQPLFDDHGAIVLPYTGDFTAQSGVVYLALAYELPVIATRAGGLRDLFDRFQIGRTFAEGSADELAAAVRSLFALEDTAHLAEQIKSAKEESSWQSTARATLAGYGTAWKGRRSADEHVARAQPAC
jgi:glycosyltransferase involved in cell wall biosynthesis